MREFGLWVLFVVSVVMAALSRDAAAQIAIVGAIQFALAAREEQGSA